MKIMGKDIPIILKRRIDVETFQPTVIAEVSLRVEYAQDIKVNRNNLSEEDKEKWLMIELLNKYAENEPVLNKKIKLSVDTLLEKLKGVKARLSDREKDQAVLPTLKTMAFPHFEQEEEYYTHFVDYINDIWEAKNISEDAYVLIHSLDSYYIVDSDTDQKIKAFRIRFGIIEGEAK